MSTETFNISEHVTGSVHTPSGWAQFEYEPGKVTPADESEAYVLEHLVSIGAAKAAGGVYELPATRDEPAEASDAEAEAPEPPATPKRARKGA